MLKAVSIALFALSLAACTSAPDHSESNRSPASTAQKSADDTCFVAYSHQAGMCNQSAGANDASFDACLAPAKSALIFCCKTSGGSADCAADAMPPQDSAQKAVDDKCFVAYSHGASFCNQSSGNDDSAFDACVVPVKKQLRACCKQSGGSADCAADAKMPATNKHSALAKIAHERKACLASAEGQSEVGAENCEMVASKDLEKELNATYQAAIRQMDNKTAADFKATELAWLNYRAKQINFVGQTSSGGNGGGHAMSSANNELTTTRIKEILSH